MPKPDAPPIEPTTEGTEAPQMPPVEFYQMPIDHATRNAREAASLLLETIAEHPLMRQSPVIAIEPLDGQALVVVFRDDALPHARFFYDQLVRQTRQWPR